LDPAGTEGRVGTGRECQTHPASRLWALENALVEEESAAPTRHETMDAVLVEEPAERLAPGHTVVGVVEQSDRAVDAIDQPGKGRGRVIVERRGGGREADADPGGQSIDDTRHGGRIGA